MMRGGFVRMRIVLRNALTERTKYLWQWPISLALMLLVPARSEVLLHGKVDDEENLLVLALAAAGRTRNPVRLVVRDPEVVRSHLRVLAAGPVPAHVHLHKRKVASLLLRRARARAVFTSHIELASPPALRGRDHVHVTHGLGPKHYGAVRSSERALCSATDAWFEDHASGLRMGRPYRRVPGFPRIDVLTGELAALPATAMKDRLTTLGLDPEQPIVTWVPTYRVTKAYGLGATKEGRPFLETPESIEHMHRLRDLAQAAGVALVAKPHPVDAEALDGAGIKTFTNAQLWKAGLSPYQFLSTTTAMISDYSSIWVDYLATGRSLALWVPDLDQFERGRGLVGPRFASLVGELIIGTTDDESWRRFFRSAAKGATHRSDDLATIRTRIGFDAEGARTARLLDALRPMGL